MKGLSAELARNTKFAGIVCSSGDLFWSLFVKKSLHLSDEVTINFEGSAPQKKGKIENLSWSKFLLMFNKQINKKNDKLYFTHLFIFFQSGVALDFYNLKS
jgi:hypothetical protein